MDVSEQEFQAAARRGEQLRQSGHAVSAEYDAGERRLVVGLSSGVTLLVPVHLMEALAEADPAALHEIEITPSGLGLHWPALDADVYVPGLMQGVFGSKRWMAAQLGAAGGGPGPPPRPLPPGRTGPRAGDLANKRRRCFAAD